MMREQKDKTGIADAERPLVSVVMVAYNSAPYIGEAIEGVVRQRCGFGVQLVICDDASTDNTAEVVRSWDRRFPGIIDYHRNEHNLGVQRNYLEALSRCRGKYITMCDADDYWCCRTKLARQVRYMESHPECALTYHRVINYYEATGEMSLSNGGGLVARTPQELAAHNTVTNLSVMYRADLVNVRHLPAWLPEVRLVDYALHMLFARHGGIHYMSRPMGVYRHLPTAIWSQAEQSRRLAMALDVRRHLIEELADRPDLTDPLRQACDNMVANARRPTASTTARKPLLSRLRAAISRLFPVPKP